MTVRTVNKILIENKELKNKLKNIIIDDKVKNKNLNENEIKIKEKNEVEDKVENKVENKVKNKVEEEIKEIGKIKKIKTSIHDVMMIQLSLNNIKTQYTNKKDMTLTGDLGYLSSKKYKLNDENIL